MPPRPVLRPGSFAAFGGQPMFTSGFFGLGKQGMKVTRMVSKGGTMIEMDNRGRFIGQFYDIMDIAADAGAEVLRKSMIEVFDKQGAVDGAPWKANEPATLEWKKGYSDQIMKGRWGLMVNAAKKISVVSPGEGGFAPLRPGRAKGGEATRFVGVFDQSAHPDAGGLTVAEMFVLHEFGSRDGHIEARPWISRASDLAQGKALDVTQEMMIAGIEYLQLRYGEEMNVEMGRRIGYLRNAIPTAMQTSGGPIVPSKKLLGELTPINFKLGGNVQ